MEKLSKNKTRRILRKRFNENTGKYAEYSLARYANYLEDNVYELVESLDKMCHMDDDLCKCNTCKVAKPIIEKLSL